MSKQIIIFITLLIVSSSFTILFGDNTEKNNLFGGSLYTSSTIDISKEIIINSSYNQNINYNMNEQELEEFAKQRIIVIESDDLTNTIEIYTINLYEEVTKKSVIDINGNEISINSDLAQLSTYVSLPFIPYAQFDSNYLEGVPYRIYEIHIPKDVNYSFGD